MNIINDENRLKNFRSQIKEDIASLQERVTWDNNIEKEEYAFNYWILENIYNQDIETCEDNITEYNDKGIDCWVHHENEKNLYLIQNKYYSEDTTSPVKDLGDFLIRPLSVLLGGNYKNKNLQQIFKKIKEDTECTIHLHFYLTHENKHLDFDNAIKNYSKPEKIKAEVKPSLFLLNNIYDKYWGPTFKDNPKFETKFTTKNKGTYLRISPKEYDLVGMRAAFYVLTPVVDIFRLYEKAEKEKYPLFEKNIREYLGGGTEVNKNILKTLKDSEQERKNFFYYNNGITIICDEVKPDSGTSKNTIQITKPQIVNGCQTVNSIFEVLNKHDDKKRKEEFESTYVMTKIIEIKENNKKFYRDIVKYTNSQNAINEKVFGAVNEPFYKIQESLEKNGILLLVKQSDKHTFKNVKYKNNKEKQDLIDKANKHLKDIDDLEIKKLEDCQIQLDKLLLLIGAFAKNYHFAYTKKSKILVPKHEIYEDFSSQINDEYNTKELITIIFLYKKIEFDRKKNTTDEDKMKKKFPAPYFVLNFLKALIGEKKIEKFSLKDIFYLYKNILKNASQRYCEEKIKDKEIDFNTFVKQETNESEIKKFMDEEKNRVATYNEESYNKIKNILEKAGNN